MNLLIFQNPYQFFQFFRTSMKIPILKKNLGYNRSIVSSITWKVLLSVMKSCYKTHIKYVMLHSFFLIFECIFKNVKKIEKFM